MPAICAPPCRNITVTGVSGKPHVLLDLRFLMSVLELCDTCIFNIRDIDLTNERRGANAQLDLFLGAGNSVINLTNVVRKRLSCTPIGPALELVERTSRAPGYPAPDGSMRQIFREQDVTWRGKLYPATLHLINYSALFPRHYNGGYNLLLNNVYRMCDHFVDLKCLEQNDAEICVYEDIDRLLAGQAGDQGAAGLTAGAVAGIVVAAVLVAAAVAAGLLLCIRHRSTTGRWKDSSSSNINNKDPSYGAKDPEFGLLGVLTAGVPPTSVTRVHTTDALAITAKSGSRGSNNKDAADSSIDSITEPLSAAAHHDLPSASSSCDLRFGALLGSGSFGRVYRARWVDRDVAVKVIEHDRAMAEAVANEVQLMLSCNHPNVVRAYHYITININGSRTGSLGDRYVSSGDLAALTAVATSSDAATAGGTALAGTGGNNSAGTAALGALQQLLPPLQNSGGTVTPTAAHDCKDTQSPAAPLQQDGQPHRQRRDSPDSVSHNSDKLLPLNELQSPPQPAQHEVKSLLLNQQVAVPHPPFVAAGAGGGVAVGCGDLPPGVVLQEGPEWGVEAMKTWLIQVSVGPLYCMMEECIA
eukprot:GHUV01018633.1.p1 GENE.GHUV01018633.1~~GHUV01018633.1.p1  ORF type:complete len:586 (+),score=150.76 GHUV01018633.1:908-2665(+)